MITLKILWTKIGIVYKGDGANYSAMVAKTNNKLAH